MYIFCSERQLMFCVGSGLRRIRVNFTEPNEGGMSMLVIKTKSTAEAIMRHPYFKRGTIKLVEKPDEEVPGMVADGGHEMPSDQTENVKPDGETSGTVAEFSDFTKAKEWLSKTYGVDKRSIKTPELLLAKAKELGVEVRF